MWVSSSIKWMPCHLDVTVLGTKWDTSAFVHSKMPQLHKWNCYHYILMTGKERTFIVAFIKFFPSVNSLMYDQLAFHLVIRKQDFQVNETKSMEMRWHRLRNKIHKTSISVNQTFILFLFFFFMLVSITGCSELNCILKS